MNRMPASPLITRALEVAERILGMDELCRRLGVTKDSVVAWRTGMATMPQYKFLQLVDLLADLDPAWREWDDEQRDR
jgi:hypothetical protein